MNQSKYLRISWLLVRVSFIIIFTPTLYKNLFIPFLASNSNLNFDPWHHWLSAGGASNAFPYGYSMYLIFFPAAFLGNIISNFLDLSQLTTTSFLVSATILLIDFGVSKYFHLLRSKNYLYLILTNFSPLLIYISYVHGQLDIVPTFLLVLSLTLVKRSKWLFAGLLLGLGISTKLSLVLAVPFILIFFLVKRGQMRALIRFSSGLFLTSIISIAPLIYSTSFKTMVLSAPEIRKSISLSVNLGTASVLILPIAYLLLFIWFWNLNRVNTEILIPFIGCALLVVSSLQTASIGWYFWGAVVVIPYFQFLSRRTQWFFLTWQIGVILFFSNKDNSLANRFSSHLKLNLDPLYLSLIFTITLLLALILILKILNESLKISDPINLSIKPLSIAIAGDSGVGKDTLTSAISQAFGEDDTLMILGDDYHLKERGDQFWKSTTHLNPAANDLQQLNVNFLRALDREPVQSRRYDHGSGRFTLPETIYGKDLILLNGLHTLLISNTEKIDLKIYLSMDEDLRINLKLQRDSFARNHSDEAIKLSIEQRREDFHKYVFPQQEVSDVHFHIFSSTDNQKDLSVLIKSNDQIMLNDFIARATWLNPEKILFDVNSENKVQVLVDAWDFTDSENQALLESVLPEYQKIVASDPKCISGLPGFLSVFSIYAAAYRRKKFQK